MCVSVCLCWFGVRVFSSLCIALKTLKSAHTNASSGSIYIIEFRLCTRMCARTGKRTLFLRVAFQIILLFRIIGRLLIVNLNEKNRRYDLIGTNSQVANTYNNVLRILNICEMALVFELCIAHRLMFYLNSCSVCSQFFACFASNYTVNIK